MKTEEKLKGLTKWLDNRMAKYDVPEGNGDVKLTTLDKNGRKVVVFACPQDDEKYLYDFACRCRAKAFFIRDSDSVDFVIEKMEHCLDGWSMKRVRKENETAAKRKSDVPPKKRMRTRIHKPVYERVGYNKKKS